jgi:hypothetical protein
VNEAQYRRLCECRRVAGPLALSAVSPRAELRRQRGGRVAPAPLAAVVAKAVRGLRHRKRAADAWQRVAQPEWLAQTVVDAVEGDTAIIAAAGSTLAYELRRRSTALGQALAALVPGLRRVRFIVSGELNAGRNPHEE